MLCFLTAGSAAVEGARTRILGPAGQATARFLWHTRPLDLGRGPRRRRRRRSTPRRTRSPSLVRSKVDHGGGSLAKAVRKPAANASPAPVASRRAPGASVGAFDLTCSFSSPQTIAPRAPCVVTTQRVLPASKRSRGACESPVPARFSTSASEQISTPGAVPAATESSQMPSQRSSASHCGFKDDEPPASRTARNNSPTRARTAGML